MIADGDTTLLRARTVAWTGHHGEATDAQQLSRLFPVDAGEQAVWWVLHAKPRTEKVLAAHLTQGGIRHYLPLVSVRHTYAKSKVAFEKPLFPGYVFLFGGGEERLAALRTNRVVNVLRVADQNVLERELKQIQGALDAGAALELFSGIEIGTRCRVVLGSLRGIEGVVTSMSGRSRLHLAVTVLGQSAVLEIDAAMIERLE